MHPLHPLQPHYRWTLGNGQKTLNCNYCDKTWIRNRNSGSGKNLFKTHLNTEHPGLYSEEYDMTDKDLELKADVSHIHVTG